MTAKCQRALLQVLLVLKILLQKGQVLSMNKGTAPKGTAPGTVGTIVTAPEVTSTNDEHASEVTSQLPIGTPAAPIRMISVPEVPNRPCLRPDPLPLVPEFV